MKWNRVVCGDFLNFDNKAWEVQLCQWEDWTNYFNFSLSFTRKTDHAGFRFNAEILGLFLEAQIYDTRHWDYSTDTWECN